MFCLSAAARPHFARGLAPFGHQTFGRFAAIVVAAAQKPP